MARLIGLIGNRADLAARVLASESEALQVSSAHFSGKGTSSSLGWGIGFYQGGEVLMRRRPIDDHATVDVAKVAGDVRADVLVGHVRNATVGSLRTENTHPFRYRQWLFAQTGTLPSFEAIRDRLLGERARVPPLVDPRRERRRDPLLRLPLVPPRRGAPQRRHQRSVARPRRAALVRGGGRRDGGGGRRHAEPDQRRWSRTARTSSRCIAARRWATASSRGRATPKLSSATTSTCAGRRPSSTRCTSCCSRATSTTSGRSRRRAPTAQSRWKVVPERAIVTLERGKDPHIEPI